MASTAVVTRDFLPKRGHGMATRARVPALLEFESPTAALVRSAGQACGPEHPLDHCLSDFRLDGRFRPVSD